MKVRAEWRRPCAHSRTEDHQAPKLFLTPPPVLATDLRRSITRGWGSFDPMRFGSSARKTKRCRGWGSGAVSRPQQAAILLGLLLLAVYGFLPTSILTVSEFPVTTSTGSKSLGRRAGNVFPKINWFRVTAACRGRGHAALGMRLPRRPLARGQCPISANLRRMGYKLTSRPLSGR
jgi:hypothetical protein